MNMTEFFSAMGGFEKTLWYIAIPSSLVFLITMILTFAGDIDGDLGDDAPNSDIDTDGDGVADHAGFQFFTFKNFVYFFTTFSWTGIVCLGEGFGREATLVLSTLSGLTVMFIMAALFYTIHRMSENRSIKLEDSIGKTGTVDLKIPAKGHGSGKINVTLGGALRNMDATSQGPEITRGEKVKIVKVENNELVVETE